MVESLQLAGLAGGALVTAAAIQGLGLSRALLVLGVGLGVITACGVLKLRSAMRQVRPALIDTTVTPTGPALSGMTQRG